jgi:hypothetical protein
VFVLWLKASGDCRHHESAHIMIRRVSKSAEKPTCLSKRASREKDVISLVSNLSNAAFRWTRRLSEPQFALRTEGPTGVRES